MIMLITYMLSEYKPSEYKNYFVWGDDWCEIGSWNGRGFRDWEGDPIADIIFWAPIPSQKAVRANWDKP